MKTQQFLSKSAWTICLAMALCATGCTNHDLYDPNQVEEQQENQYNENFNTLIGGTVSPNQTWNMSTYRTLDVNVGGFESASYTLKLYTSNPNYAGA